MDKEEAIDILSSFAEHEKWISFHAHATKEEVEAMEFAVQYMQEN